MSIILSNEYSKCYLSSIGPAFSEKKMLRYTVCMWQSKLRALDERSKFNFTFITERGFTIYGQGGHLGHVNRTFFFINFGRLPYHKESSYEI